MSDRVLTLNMGKNVLGGFEVSLTFPGKWFCIRWAHFTFLSLIPIFNRSEDSTKTFERLQNKFIGNARNFLESFKVCLVLLEKWFCICWPNLEISIVEPIFNRSEDLICGFRKLQKNFIGNSNMKRDFFESFKVCLHSSKNGFVFDEEILHFGALYQYLVTKTIQFRPFRDVYR